MELDILQRLAQLTREQPGAVYSFRGWYDAATQEHHHILEFTSGAEQWRSVGTSPGEAYCELRRRMVMGE